MDISHLIPIGYYPYLARANILNIAETCENLKDIDIVFLTHSGPTGMTPQLQETLDELSKQYPFRVLQCDENLDYELGQLLDWAIYHEGNELREFISLQHADTFWKKSGWLLALMSAMGENTVCVNRGCNPEDGLRPTHNHKYIRGLGVVGYVTDNHGLFKKDYILENHLTLDWGHINESKFDNVGGIDTIRNLARAGKLYGIESDNSEGMRLGKLGKDPWFDGAQLFSVYLALDPTSQLAQLPAFGHTYFHPDNVLRALKLINMEEDGKVLRIYDKSTLLEGWSKASPVKVCFTSWVSCCCFDMERDPIEKIIPLSIVSQLFPKKVFRSSQNLVNKYGELLLKYVDPKAKRFGGRPAPAVERIEFTDDSVTFEVENGVVKRPKFDGEV